VILLGNVGYIADYDPYPNNNGSGDSAKAKKLLAQAGYPNGPRSSCSTRRRHSRAAHCPVAQSSARPVQVKLVPATQSTLREYPNSSTAARRLGHRAAGVDPDWSNNGPRH
jgi:ABC-type transport system substrate-binding protein